MPVQQRYTPVPGMGRAAPTNMGGSYQDNNSPPVQGSGSSNPFEMSNLYDGRMPGGASQRFSNYSDPSLGRPVSTASLTDPAMPVHSRADSNASYKDYPAAAGAAAGAGAGVGAGAGAGAGGEMREMSQVPHSSYATGGAGDRSMAYQNVPSETYWNEPSRFNNAGYSTGPAVAKSSKKKWAIIVGVVLGLAAIGGIVAGVVVSQVHKSSSGSNSSSASGSGSGGGSSSGNSSSVLSDPNDPSNFQKDSALHNSFWGFAYTPQGGQPPTCGSTQANVTRDIQLLSQLTTRLRLYSANCNATAQVLQAIKDTKVNMTIWAAIYVDSDTSAFTTQVTALTNAIKAYGTDNIEGITVGNEYILDNDAAGTTTSSAYTTAVNYLLTQVKSVNTTIQGLSLSKHLPIGTSDAGSLMSTSLATGIEYFMANVHPWFGSLAIQDAATWTYEYFQTNDVAIAQQVANKPETYIAETGWPTASMNVSLANDGAGSPQGDASVANLQTFLNTFVCQANANGTKYFYFEAFDEPWKEIYGGVEPYWGLFDSNRNLKNVTIPTC